VRKESYGSVTVFWLEAAEAVRRLAAAARADVAERSDVIAVYLFGSLAEGRAVPGSDADVLILVERSERRWLDRPLEFYRYFVGCGIGVELFCYTRDEAVRNPMARQAKRAGIRLAGRDGDS
jgi:UTP:GlnB (protein PII) uridylyltransferase